ncbi:MAG: NADH:ubiquinone oxidoreductase, partial [Gammaproteobacteria bacterium]|nr:NADH:ubiquinone oxidoreductase [Gammaproteobacteria bacterium]
MATLFWIQTGACGGDSLAILSAEAPSLEGLLAEHGVELLWHPSLSHQPMRFHDRLIERILAGEQALDMLCVEGSIITAPR